MAEVLGEDLAKLAYNAYQFVNPKSIYLPGEILFVVNESALRVYSCDDYIAFTETIPVSGESSEFQFSISLEAAKELEKFARTNKKYKLEIKKKMHDVVFYMDSENEEEDAAFNAELKPERNETWDIVDVLLFEECERKAPGDYYTRPERIANLSKLKVPKEAPIGWRHVDLNGSHLIRFRMGGTVNGVIKPVNEEDILEQYLWEDS